MPRRDDPLTYEREMGRPPANLPEDHPDRWQWEYRGTPVERAKLREELGFREDQDISVEVIDGQEDMFAC